MTTYTVQPNQSMCDVVLQCLGTMEAGMQFCLDNGVALSDVPVKGSEMIVSDAAIALAGSAGAQVVAQYILNGVTVGNLNLVIEPPLTDTDGDGLTDTDGDILTD